MTMRYRGRNAVVLGLGLTGLSLARYLVRQGADVRVADTRADPPNRDALAGRRCRTCRVVTGPFVDETFADADLIAISPGVDARDAGDTRGRGARRRRSSATSSSSRARCLPDQKVLAITGTNGKTTVAALTGALTRAAGLPTVVAGNIGDARARRARDANGRCAVAARLRARAFELSARDDDVAEADCRRRAQRLGESHGSLCGNRRLRGREGAHLRAGDRADPESRRSDRAADAAARPDRADVRRGRAAVGGGVGSGRARRRRRGSRAAAS